MAPFRVSYELPNKYNLYGAIAFAWYRMHTKNENFSFKYETSSINDKISKNYFELKKYAEVLRMLFFFNG